MTPVDAIVAVLRDHRFSYAAEDTLQHGIATVLTEAGIDNEREVRLTARDRVDVLVGRVAIEVKIALQPVPTVRRQLARYAAHPDIDALIVVTNSPRHFGLPAQLNDVPITVVCLAGGSL